MPPFAVDSLLAIRPISEVPFEQLRPNARRRVSLRANAEARLNPRLDLSVSSGFISSTQRLPQTDNNTTGLLSNALGGLGNKAGGKYGYRAFTPDEMLSETVTQDINRSEEHTSELQSQSNLVCRLLLEKKKNKRYSDSRICGQIFNLQ